MPPMDVGKYPLDPNKIFLGKKKDNILAILTQST
jgi:hypothetical protein